MMQRALEPRRHALLVGLLVVAIALVGLNVVLQIVDIVRDKSAVNQSAVLAASLQRLEAANSETRNEVLAALKRPPPATGAAKPLPAPPPPPPPPPVMATIDCEVLVIGAGVGGLTAGYRLAPLLGSRLCIVDERPEVGGKVRSVFYAAGSTSARPVWTPTHAEQLRGGDSILRCIGQEVGMVTVKRGRAGLYLETIMRGVNVTSYACYGNVSTPPASATCKWGEPYEFFLAPNGGSPATASTYALPAGLCGNKDWTVCSYFDQIMTGITASTNAGTIRAGETFRDYVTRLYNADTFDYFNEIYGNYFQEASAKWSVEYLNYDNAYAYGHMTVTHGGPQEGLLKRMARLIEGNGTRIVRSRRIETLNRATGSDASDGYRYVAVAPAANVRYRANRTLLAFPAGHLASMSGDLVDTLRASPYITNTGAVKACAWNAFFPSKWWHTDRLQCNYDWCAFTRNFTLTDRGLDYLGWNFVDPTPGPDSLGFVQYMPTPERQQGNLLRFIVEEDDCSFLDTLYASGGLDAVSGEYMRRVRARFGPTVPAPTFAVYNSEPFAFAKLLAAATYGQKELTAWASAPLAGEAVAFASESFYPSDSGWQEGAARSAHLALGGRVFADLISGTTLSQLARCRANVSAANRYLDPGNKNSGNDVCLLLRNEYHMRDLANYSYCGGPSEYVWPALSDFTGTASAYAELLNYTSATTTAVYDTQSVRRRMRRSG
jgi:hypothetical protein